MNEFNRQIDRLRAERVREEQESRRRNRSNSNLSSRRSYRTSGFQPPSLLSSSPLPPSPGPDQSSHRSFLPPPVHPSGATGSSGPGIQKSDFLRATQALLQELDSPPGPNGPKYRSLLLPPIYPSDPTTSSGGNSPVYDLLSASRAPLYNLFPSPGSSFDQDSSAPHDDPVNLQYSGRNSLASDAPISPQLPGRSWGSNEFYLPTTFLLPFDHPLNPPRSFASFQERGTSDEPASSQYGGHHSDGAITPDSDCSQARSDSNRTWDLNFDAGSLKNLIHLPPRGRSRIPRANSDFGITRPIDYNNPGSSCSTRRGSAASSDIGFAKGMPTHDPPLGRHPIQRSQSNPLLPLNFFHWTGDSENIGKARNSKDEKKAGPSTWKGKERARSPKSKGKGRGKGKKQPKVPDTDEGTKAYVRGYNDAISDIKFLEHSHQCQAN